MDQKSVETAFYTDRELPEPRREYRPEQIEDLRRLVERGEAERPALLIGGGEHLRTQALGGKPFDAIRTDELDGISALDPESNVVRVRSGTEWSALRELLRDRGLSLGRYRLHPAGATIGGLLARRRPLEKQLFTGDLREGCVALTTITPGSGDYEYIPAPRKASGPDHRFLHIGGEGFAGAILEASLVVWPEHDGRLFIHPAEEAASAVALYRKLVRLDLRISWCRWSSDSERLEAALHGPPSLLRNYGRRVRTEFGDAADLQGSGAVRERRRRLEREHPGGRSSDGASRTVEVWWNLEDLPRGLEEVADEVDRAVVDRWSRRRVGVHLVAGGSEPGWNREQVPFARGLAFRRVVDDGTATWPAWARCIKGQLDPDRTLATGPEPTVN